MFRPEERSGLQLRSFGSLIRARARSARQQEARIAAFLKEFKKGDYQHIAEFETAVESLLTDTLEKIRLTAERDEHHLIEHLHHFAEHVTPLLIELNRRDIRHLRAIWRRGLRKLLHELKQERRDARRLGKGKQPSHTFFKRLLGSRALEKQVNRDGSALLQLTHDEEDAEQQLKNLLLLSERRGLSAEQRRYGVKAFTTFLSVVLEEFRRLHEAEVDIDIHESRLVADLAALVPLRTIHPQVEQVLHAIQKRFRNDCSVAKRLYMQARALREKMGDAFEHALDETKGFSFRQLEGALRDFNLVNLHDAEAERFLWYTIGMESGSKESKEVPALWPKATLPALLLRVHELAEMRSILNDAGFREAGGFPALRREVDRLSVEQVSAPAVRAWIAAQSAHGHPRGILAENRALLHLYQSLIPKDEQKPLQTSSFFAVNPFRVEYGLKDFLRDPVGRLNAAEKKEWFQKQLFEPEPTPPDLEEAIRFVQRCGYSYHINVRRFAQSLVRNRFAKARHAPPVRPMG